MLLIYPPAARSSEPPLGIARLAAYLRKNGREASCLDLCQEGIEYLLGLERVSEDPWTSGALKRRVQVAAALRDPATYASPDRYARAVGDLNRALLAVSAPAQASLADYRDPERSPLRRADLMASAREYRSNVYFPLIEDRIGPAIEDSADGLVGISLCYLSQALCAFAIAGYIKSVRPATQIIMGGGLVTSWLAGATIGPGENFEGLIEALLSGPGEEALGRYLGIDATLPGAPPDFGDFSGLGYFAPSRIIPYNFSFGCPWKRCSFCPEKAEDLAYRGIRAPAAAAELDMLSHDNAPGLFHFTDNEVSPLYLRSLAVNPPGPAWYGFARFSPILLDGAFCESLAASGCLMLQLGLESGDQGVLDALGKGTRLEDISLVLENLRDAGIGVYLYVLFGTPAEDRETALRTRDFIAERSGSIGFLNVAIFNLPVSSPEANELETRPFYEGELSLYREFRHPRGWDRTQVRSFLSRDFESVAEIRTIVKRTPPIFTSSHAPFLWKATSPRQPAQH